MKCPHCDAEMDEDIAQEGICSECGEEFDPNALEADATCSECGEETDADDLEDGSCPKCRRKKG